MPNASRPSGAKATGLLSGRFHRAQIRLTLIYVAILATTLALSSSITYSAFSQRLSNRFNRIPPHVIELPDGRLIIPTPRDVRADLIWALIVVNGVLLTIGGIFSYWFAGITLDPIERAYDRQRKFLSDASHELRTPLAILQTSLENKAGDHGSELHEVERMGALVSDLLALSRLDETAHRAIEKKIIPVTEILSEPIERFAPLAMQASLALKTDIAPELADATILGNKELLARALGNLIKNAIQYTQQGSITVRASRVGQIVSITIADTGLGIAPEHLDKIFGRFYRADESRSRATGGSGLGLAIVESIIRDHNGSVSVTSILGSGTAVTVSLPIHMAS